MRFSKPKYPKVDAVFDGFSEQTCVEEWPAWDGKTESCRKSLEDECPGTIANQVIAGRLIWGFPWFKIWQLGSVKFDPSGKPEDNLKFKCGELQGVLCPMDWEGSLS